MLGFNEPIPEAFEKVNALQHFTGKEPKRYDLRQYDQWYTQQAIEWLMHCEPRNTDSPLRVVFQTANSMDTFYKQLGNFNILRNALNKPGFFISTEPGSGQNHFICGIFYSDMLLIINPIGETQHQDFYDALMTAQKELSLKVIVAETPIQHDPQQSLVSCGPICIELMDYFFQKNLKDFFEVLSKQGVEKTNRKFRYQAVDLTSHLPPLLQQLLAEKEPERYKTYLRDIRLNHYFRLLEICKLLQNVKEINEYFAEECINASEQLFLNMLLLNELSILSFDDNPLYKALSVGEPSILAAKIKQIRLEKLKQEKIDKLSAPVVTPPISPQHDDIAHLKMIRNIMLLCLILIPVAHFFVWPYLVPMFSLAVAEFLTASTTPWLFAALTTVFFSALIIGTATYEEYHTKRQPYVGSDQTVLSESDFIVLEQPNPSLQFSNGTRQDVVRLPEYEPVVPTREATLKP